MISPRRWSLQAVSAWYQQQPWITGANYLPSSAVNQLETFQAETFDPALNDREIGLAASLGFNTLRVFLHDLLWPQSGFLDRFDQFLAIAAKHGMRVMPVLFDSCWDPTVRPGPQPPPIPGVHNSRWVQAPGALRLVSPAAEPLLQAYVEGIIAVHRDDPRILLWDLWNEPDNGWGVYSDTEAPDKLTHVARLLTKSFDWARNANPTQPLTSGLWVGDFTDPSTVQQIQLSQSDVLSFHNYEPATSFLARVESLRPHGRPILCTEYMARNQASTFAAILPVAREQHVAAIHWGLVTGRTQTRFPWDSWQHPYTDREPQVWCHDVFHPDGTPYLAAETELIASLTRPLLP